MLQIGICDDETVIAARMEELIFETCRAEGIQAGVEVFYSGNTLSEEVRRGTRYDLLYLDIHMQKGNGISAAEQIRKLDDNVLLIFVSGYDQYLMELFRLDVFEFVKKPFEKESFVQTFLRAVRKVGEKNHYFVYAYRGEEFKLPCMEILYFESRGRKIWIHMKNETAFFNGKLSDAFLKNPPVLSGQLSFHPVQKQIGGQTAQPHCSADRCGRSCCWEGKSMYEVGKSILNLMLLISTVWIIYRVLGTFFEKRKWTVLSWISWGPLITFQAFVEFRDQLASGIWMLTITICLVTLVSITCYRKAGIRKLLIVAFLYSFWSVTEIFVYTFIRMLKMDARSTYDLGELCPK